MTTITDEQGIINNFAKEPQVYYAQAPSSREQREYIFWGAIAAVLVAASVLTAIVVS